MMQKITPGDWQGWDFNIGVNFGYWVEGLPAVLLGFVIVVFLEAFFLTDFLPWRKSIWCSFVVNIISTIIGVPLLPSAGLVFSAVFSFLPFWFLFYLPLFYFVTAVIEFGAFLIFFKPSGDKKKLLKAFLGINFYSYIALFLLFFILGLVAS